MLVTVIIPATRAHTVSFTIRSVLRQTYKEFQLLIVSHRSDWQVRVAIESAIAQDARAEIVFVEGPGASRARNAALAAALGTIIAMTDDDCEVTSDWLANVVEIFENDRALGLVGGALLAPPLREGWLTCMTSETGPGRHGRPIDCPALIPAETVCDPGTDLLSVADFDWVTANCALRQSVIQLAGEFDEYLGPGTEFPVAEDTDYKLRLARLGIRMRSTPRLIARHTFGRRTGFNAVCKLLAQYAAGAGGLAAKLMMVDDASGLEREEQTLARYGGSESLAIRLEARYRWHHFRRAYEHCLRSYTVDDAGLLKPLAPGAPNSIRQ